MKEMRIPWLVWIGFAACGLACGGYESSAALDAAFELGEKSSELALEAASSGRHILDEMEIEPFTYRRVEDVDDVPTLSTVCGVRYRISDGEWGLLPEVTHPCGDEEAAEAALRDAREQLEAHLSLPASDYALRLASFATPANALADDGPGLVFARGIGVEVDLDDCVDAVGERLAEASAAVAELQCQTFLSPGSLLEDFRDDLRQRADRASDLTADQPAQPAIAISPDVAGLCGALPGAPGPPVPGAVAGSLSDGDAAHAIRLEAGQTVEIELRSTAFDSYLTLYDASCSTELASNDDGAGGRDSRLVWTEVAGGDYVLLVGSYGMAQAAGPYSLSVSVGTASGRPVLDAAQRQALDGFVRWVGEAPEEELLDAWRGGSGADLQLGCLRQERFRSAAASRAAVAGEARSVCLEALNQATEARKMVLAAKD